VGLVVCIVVVVLGCLMFEAWLDRDVSIED
jgi:hypothetical protein